MAQVLLQQRTVYFQKITSIGLKAQIILTGVGVSICMMVKQIFVMALQRIVRL